MGFLLACLLSATPAADRGASPSPPERARHTLTVSLGGDVVPRLVSFVDNASAGGNVEFTFRVPRWFRLGGLLSAAWVPPFPPGYPGQHGLFRALAVADVVVAAGRADFFAGVGLGGVFTNLLYDDLDHPLGVIPPGYTTGWQPGIAVLLRAGAEWLLTSSFGLGVDLGYAFFSAPRTYDFRHAVEAHARVSFHF